MTGPAPLVSLGPSRSTVLNAPAREPLIGSLFSVFLCLCVAAISVVPVDIAGLDAGFVPHPALAFLFALSARSAARLGPLGVFVIGLAFDVLTVSPLGICAASYLLVHAAIRYEADGLSRLPGSARFFAFTLLAALVVGAHSLAVMALGGTVPDPQTLAASLAVTAAIYPLAAWLVRPGREERGAARGTRPRPLSRPAGR